MLIDAMRRFPDGHTGDILMALWFAWSEMRDKGGKTIRIPRTTLQEAIDNANSAATMTPEQIKEEERLADLEAMRQAEAARRGVLYVPVNRAKELAPDIKRKLTF
jgi:hypothetical protein